MRKALLLIDLLKDYLPRDQYPNAKLPQESMRGVVEKARRILEHARSQGWAVLYVNDAHHPEDSEIQYVGAHCMAGSGGAEIIDDLKPTEGEPVLLKRRRDGFSNPDLERRLSELRVEEIWEVGDFCVLPTAETALRKGFRVKVVRDAATKSPKAPKLNLIEELAKLGVELPTTGEIVEEY